LRTDRAGANCTEFMAATIIGITGKCCTGKNEAAEYLQRSGWHVIDVDRTGHHALAIEKDRLVERFGPKIVAPDGSVDRRVLGGIVFNSRKELQALESIVHPRMRGMVRSEAEQYRGNGRNVCINAALLFPMQLHTICEHVVRVRAPLCVRICRARRRDGLKLNQIVRRFAAQRRLFSKKLTRNVDMYNVWNSADREALYSEIREFLKSIERQG